MSGRGRDRVLALGVERVMGFCTDEQAKTFLKGVPLVERAIIDSGVILL